MQAAAGVGLTLLLQDRPYDPSCVISATVDAEGKLGMVNGILNEGHPKLQAALELRRAGQATVVVSPDNVPDRAYWKTQGLEIRAADNVEQALEIASGRATRMLHYFDWLIEWPDRDLPVYLAGRKRSELYIPPYVLRLIPGSTGQDMLVDQDAGEFFSCKIAGYADAADVLADQDMAAGFAPHGAGDLDAVIERRVPWLEEMKNLDSDACRVVLLANPGQGKTLLTRMSARQLAQDSRAALAREGMGSSLIPLPLVISLRNLEAAWRTVQEEEDGDPCSAVLRALQLELPFAQRSFASDLAERAATAGTWLVLDGLDELENSARFRSFFEAIADWACRVIVTSRPYGYEKQRLPFPTIQYQISPLTEEQGRRYVDSWGSLGRSSAFHGFLQKSFGAAAFSAGQVTQNPFLLTLLIAVLERLARDRSEDTARVLNRTEIYEKVLQDLLGRDPDDPGSANHIRAEILWPLVTEIAFAFFLEHPGNPEIPSGWLIPLISDSKYRDPSDTPKLLLEELQKKRILAPVGPEKDFFSFPHPTIHEFFAASYLARTIERDGWDEAVIKTRGKKVLASRLINAKAWMPQWQEVLVFLAGRNGGSPTAHRHPHFRPGRLSAPPPDSGRHFVCPRLAFPSQRPLPVI